MKRLTADVFEGRIVFVAGTLAAGCEEAGCSAPASGACNHDLTGKRAGEVCGRRFCERHAMMTGGKLRCGSHARWMMKRGVW